MENVRRRVALHTNGKRCNEDPLLRPLGESRLIETNRDQLGVAYWLLCAAGFFMLFYVSISAESTCGFSARSPDDGGFQERLARKHMREIENMGPRPTGSEANEIHAPKYLVDVLEKHAKMSGNLLRTEVSSHLAKLGSFPLNILLPNNPLVSVYENIRNIAFRIYASDGDSKDGNRSAILINCHYDSVVGSPGASDDFVSCAVMLDVIRALLVRQPSLKHDLIFLFNGAEENLLQAAHAFVSQHPWMKEVRLLVNLEAAGADGRQLLFQTGPEIPWIVEEFARAYASPFASVVAQDIFESGIVPSDTDFRIFRDFGGVTGLDLAYIKNGYVYHTEMDVEQRIPAPCVQLAGDNLLRFLSSVANSPYVTAPQNRKMGLIVYFDFFSLFLIYYEGFWIYLFNYGTVVLVAVKMLWNLMHSGRAYLKGVALAAASHFVYFLTSAVFLLSLGLAIHFMGRRMAWFSNRYNIAGLYLLPLILYSLCFHNYVVKRFPWWPSNKVAQESHFDALQLILCIVIVTLTYAEIGSAILFVIWVLFPFLWSVISKCPLGIFKAVNLQVYLSLSKLLLFAFPYTFYMYTIYAIFDLFVPILGRSGQDIIPEIFIVIILLIGSLVPLTYFMGDVYITKERSMSSMCYFLLHITLSYLLLVNLTNYGMPYSGSIIEPRRQRIAVIHENKIMRDMEGSIASRDSKIWFIPMDYSGVRYLREKIPELEGDGVFCNVGPYCGFAHLYPIAAAFKEAYYLRVEPHDMNPAPRLKVIENRRVNETTVNITFSVDGPSHSHVFLMTERGVVSLTAWSLKDLVPTPEPISVPSERPFNHYFIYYSYGIRPSKPFEFWALFHVSQGTALERAVVEVAISANYLHGPYMTPPLRSVLPRFPPTIGPIPWSATYDHYTVRLN